MGERVLCKHEVVGSIPSGSTSGVLGVRVNGIRRRERGWRIFDIVKREHVPRLEAAPAAWSRSDVFGKHRLRSVGAPLGVLGGLGMEMVFLTSLSGAAERRTSIMRAIKCLKGIRWMPWR